MVADLDKVFHSRHEGRDQMWLHDFGRLLADDDFGPDIAKHLDVSSQAGCCDAHDIGLQECPTAHVVVDGADLLPVASDSVDKFENSIALHSGQAIHPAVRQQPSLLLCKGVDVPLSSKRKLRHVSVFTNPFRPPIG